MYLNKHSPGTHPALIKRKYNQLLEEMLQKWPLQLYTELLAEKKAREK